MPFIIPTNNVVLYSGIKITDGEQIAFSSSSSQNAYFTAHKVVEFLDCTYIKKTGHVRLEVPTRTVMGCNYMSFTNNSFENKTIYARIVDWKYVNNVTTDILYDIDWFQTMMFINGQPGFNVDACLVEREHLTEKQFDDLNDNPYTENIPSMYTKEPLPMARSMEKRYSNADITKIDFGNENRTILIYTAGFEYPENYELKFGQWVNLFIESGGHVVIDSDNYTSGVNTDVTLAVPNAYEIIAITCKGTGDGSWRNRLKKFLEYMTEKDGTHNIIGIYYTHETAVKMWLNGNVITDLSSVSMQPYSEGIVNKKLLRAPFQYIRVLNCKGDIKEYQYERFLGDSCTFVIALTADPTPIVSLFPLNYEYMRTGLGTDSRVNYNVDERMDYGYLPQVGYCIDSYLSFLSNQYMQECATRTKWDEINSLVRLNAGVGGAVAGTAIGIVGATAGSPRTMGTGFDAALSSGSRAIDELESRDVREALKQARNGDTEKADIVFGDAKTSFVSNEYHAGVTTNLFSHYFGITQNNSIGAFVLIQVKPTQHILHMMDKFFSTYGYTVNDIKVPNICSFMQGSDETRRVKFDVNIDGYQTGRTYCKTKNAHVSSNGGAVVNSYIEDLFNNGTFFLNGDNLQ